MYHPLLPITDPAYKILEEQIKNIIYAIGKEPLPTGNISVLNGPPGTVLLYTYAYLHFEDEKYLNSAFQILDHLTDTLAGSEFHHSWSYGVAGAGFVFQHLQNLGFIDKKADLNLQELDQFILEGIRQDYEQQYWDPLHGLVGCGIYFMERHKHANQSTILQQITRYLLQLHKKVNGNCVWLSKDPERLEEAHYNFGMAHGMPGIISFLASVFTLNICQTEINEIVPSCIDYIIQHRNKNGTGSLFPSSVSMNTSSARGRVSRLGWCYGDLCIANALIAWGRACNQFYFIETGIDIALQTLTRNRENAQCVDASFCHGSSGIIHQYNCLYQLTKNEAFRQGALKWLETALEHFYLPGTTGNEYRYWTYNPDTRENFFTGNSSLLEGTAGIALVYLSLIGKTTSEWDSIFFINR